MLKINFRMSIGIRISDRSFGANPRLIMPPIHSIPLQTSDLRCLSGGGEASSVQRDTQQYRRIGRSNGEGTVVEGREGIEN